MEEEQIIELFRKKGHKVTTQRLAISEFILSRNDHPSADQIYDELRKDHPTISLATIYKTLNLLKEIGLVQELGFAETAARYDPNTNIHINMVCTECEEIKDYYPKDIETLWSELIQKLDEKIVGQRIDLYYICEKCKGNKS